MFDYKDNIVGKSWNGRKKKGSKGSALPLFLSLQPKSLLMHSSQFPCIKTWF